MPNEVYETRKEWLAGRRSRLGSSDIAAIFGYGYANQSPYTVWASKVHDIEQEVDAATQQRFDLGNVTEKLTIELFKMARPDVNVKFDKQPRIRYQKCWPWLGVTIDAYAVKPSRVIEAKFVGFGAQGDWLNDAIPMKHHIQIQSQLAATGWESGFLVGWDGNRPPMIREIPRNEPFIKSMIARLDRWWSTHVVGNEPPPVDGLKATSGTLQLLHPLDNGEAVYLSPRLQELAIERAEAKEKIKDLELIARSAENHIKAELGEATYGELPNGSAVSWKHTSRESYVVKASEFRTLRFLKKLPANAPSPEYKEDENNVDNS